MFLFNYHWSILFTRIFDCSFASRWTGTCSGWCKELVLSHVFCDLLIWGSYMVIPFVLLKIIRARKDVPFDNFFLLFSAFIVGCGGTHLMAAFTAFYPYYVIDFWIKLVTAIVSVGTAWMLVKACPKIISLPNPVASLRIEKENKQLEKVNKELESFALIAAHDLQDPLKQTKVLLRFLEQGRTDLLPEIVKNNNRLDEFVKKLLEYARSGASGLEFRDVDVKELLESVVKDLAIRISEKQTHMIIGSMPVIKCDRLQLGRVFQNLISNALKHKSPDRPLVIEINSEKISPAVWQFSVRDSGTGIPKTQMQNLFTIYRGSRLSNTGAGFGLAICKRVVECHKGKIWAISKEDEGTTFKFTIGREESDF